MDSDLDSVPPDQRAFVAVVPVGTPLVGKVRLPGSKSVTNRSLLTAAFAKGSSILRGALASDDTKHMVVGLRRMGVDIVHPDATRFRVNGTGRLRAPDGPLFLGNAGTAMRFLVGAAALADGRVVLDGDEHMRRRPIGPLVDALRVLGVEAGAEGGTPPVEVVGAGDLPGSAVVVDAARSSQYVSALLMAAPMASHPVEVRLREPEIGGRGYIDVTLSVMRAFGAGVEETDAGVWRVDSGGYLPRDFRVEPDASAATYFWGAAALTGGDIDVGVEPEGMRQPDARAYDVIRAFPRIPAVVDGAQIQDAVPTLAVLAAYNETPVRFVNIANLRVKECDRVAALAEGLNALRRGTAREEGDELVVEGDPRLAGQRVDATIDTRADHRIAMSFALAGLRTEGVRIADPDCVSKTFPSYWDALAGLGVGLRFAPD